MIIPFRPIARELTRMLQPAPRVDVSSADEYFSLITQGGQKQGVLITVNHFNAPDFQAWWFVIPVSAVFPEPIHWVVTSGWTHSGWLTGFTHWLFPIGARLLGFTAMPAMPPDPLEVEARAAAVMRVVRYARHAAQPIIGMAPEGRDFPGGVLGGLPSGVGRFLYLLSQWCPLILPVGVWKESGIINMKFGEPYQLNMPESLSSHERDQQVGNTVMRAIAQCLPGRLRGDYQ